MAFVLRPHVDTLGVNSQQGSSPDVRSGTIDLTVSPAVGREHKHGLLAHRPATVHLDPHPAHLAEKPGDTDATVVIRGGQPGAHELERPL